MLRGRLHDLVRSHAVADTTIMAITLLAAAAEASADYKLLIEHNKGLKAIIDRRGGLAALGSYTNLAVKACRYVICCRHNRLNRGSCVVGPILPMLCVQGKDRFSCETQRRGPASKQTLGSIFAIIIPSSPTGRNT